MIERAVLMASAAKIEQFDFSLQPLEPLLPSTPAQSAASAALTLDQAEQAMVRNALDQCGGNIQKTADMLGLSRAALYRRLEKYGISA